MARREPWGNDGGLLPFCQHGMERKMRRELLDAGPSATVRKRKDPETGLALIDLERS